MQELDSKVAEVEKVLQPLIEAGTVKAVRGGWAEGAESRETNLPVGKSVVTVAVMSDHPEQLYPEIRRMVEASIPQGCSTLCLRGAARAPP
jgi:hypothetical protein